MALTFLQRTQLTNDASTYTFVGENLGTAAADRHIIVAISSRRGGLDAINITSVTINGVAATITIQEDRNLVVTGNACIAALAIANVPTDTSGDIVIVLDQTMLRCAIGVFSATNLDSITAHDSASAVGVDPSTSLDVPDDGFAIGVGTSGGLSGTATWTGLATEHYDTTVEVNMVHTAASEEFPTAGTETVSVNWNSSTDNDNVIVAASWAFAAAPSGTETFSFTFY